jgi:hypothetical protein
VSLHDADARPISKGRLGKPVEFGYKAQVAENDDGVIVDHTVEPVDRLRAPSTASLQDRGLASVARTRILLSRFRLQSRRRAVHYRVGAPAPLYNLGARQTRT